MKKSYILLLQEMVNECNYLNNIGSLYGLCSVLKESGANIDDFNKISNAITAKAESVHTLYTCTGARTSKKDQFIWGPGELQPRLKFLYNLIATEVAAHFPKRIKISQSLINRSDVSDIKNCIGYNGMIKALPNWLNYDKETCWADSEGDIEIGCGESVRLFSYDTNGDVVSMMDIKEPCEVIFSTVDLPSAR